MRNVYAVSADEQRLRTLDTFGSLVLMSLRDMRDHWYRLAKDTGDAELVALVQSADDAARAVQARVAALRESEGR